MYTTPPLCITFLKYYSCSLSTLWTDVFTAFISAAGNYTVVQHKGFLKLSVLIFFLPTNSYRLLELNIEKLLHWPLLRVSEIYIVNKTAIN